MMSLIIYNKGLECLFLGHSKLFDFWLEFEKNERFYKITKKKSELFSF